MKQKTSVPMLGMIMWILCSTAPGYAATVHTYMTGSLTRISDKGYLVSGKQLVLSPKIKVVIHYRNNNAFYEKKGSSSDVGQGEQVTVKVVGNMIEEIVLKRW